MVSVGGWVNGVMRLSSCLQIFSRLVGFSELTDKLALLRDLSVSSSSASRKNFAAVLDHKLHCEVLRVHVGHLLLKAVVPHDSRREYHGQVLG